MSRTVAVIGGGISGLAAAWELSRHGADVSVTVLEGSDRLGGKLRLEDVGGARIDVGAESVLARRPEALALFGQLGLDDLTTHPGPAGAAIVSRGRLWPMPARHGHGSALRPRVGARAAHRRGGEAPGSRDRRRPRRRRRLGGRPRRRPPGRCRHRPARRAPPGRCLRRSRPRDLRRAGRPGARGAPRTRDARCSTWPGPQPTASTNGPLAVAPSSPRSSAASGRCPRSSSASS